MALKDLVPKKKSVDTVLGVDASTNSFAFCLMDKEGPIRWGEIKFKGSNVFERLAYGQRHVAAMKQHLKADLVVFEGAIYVQNKKTVILLAYAFGAVISALLNDGADIEEVSPMAWQNYIGNKALTKAEKKKIMDAAPGRKPSWYTNAFRAFRKQRTIEWVKERYGIEVESDNVADAIGVGHYARDHFILD
jgi:Holliday junction resolvasome RuvABC endonuclease subunit